MSKANMTDDEIRSKTLFEYLYRIHRGIRSLKSTRVSITQLKQNLKNLGLKEQEIVRNLDYLIRSGWVRVEKEETEFKTPIGINYFEDLSEFQRLSKSFSGITITNTQGVTVIGDQNVVVNTQYLDLYKGLSEAVRGSVQLSDKAKLEYTAEIETIKDQLANPSPDKNIIRVVWKKLKTFATVSGITSFFKQVVELIGVLIK